MQARLDKDHLRVLCPTVCNRIVLEDHNKLTAKPIQQRTDTVAQNLNVNKVHRYLLSKYISNITFQLCFLL